MNGRSNDLPLNVTRRLHCPSRSDTAAITLTFADGAVANIAVGDVGVPPHSSKFALQQSDGTRSFSLYNRLNALMTREDKKITEHQEWLFKDQARLPVLKEEFDEGIDMVKIPENE